MKAWLLVGVLVTTASCHHAAPKVDPTAPARYGFPAEAQDSDIFCVEGDANALGPVCVRVGQVRYYVRSQRYAE